MAYDYNALLGSQLRGELPQSILNQIAQRAAERGVGSGGAINVPASYILNTAEKAMDYQQAGQRAYEAQQQIALQQQELAQRAREHAANLTLEEKRLAQQLGISQMEFALKKAEMESEESRFSRELGETSRRFDSELGFKRSQLGEEGRQFDMGFGLNQAKFGESQRQFDLGLDLDRAREAEGARRFDIGADLKVAQLDPQSSFRWSWLAGQPQIPMMRGPQGNPGYINPLQAGTGTYYRRPGSSEWSLYN